MKKILSVLLTLAMLLAMTTGFAAVAEEETRTFVDSAGREVEIPANIERIIPSGQLAQSFMWPLAADKLVSLNVAMTEDQLAYVGQQYADLPITGNLYQTGSELNIEEVASLNAQIIIDFGEPKDTIVEAGGSRIGGGYFAMIAGPCSVESEEQIVGIAKSVKESGATLLRGGAFKPRTSPYAFQGMGAEGLRLLEIAKKETGLPIVTEIMNINTLDLFENVDVIQVGARNMQNFDLLKELGKTKKPILLKRGLANTLQELLMSAEYIMSEGNENVILCERGIRTFETYTRNTMDISAIPVLHELSHLPVVADPSHATGKSRLVPDMACAAVAAGADGLMIEVHNNPEKALCDGAQSLTPAQFDEMARKVKALREVLA